MRSDEELLSKTITFLRLPLIVAVVLGHTNLCKIAINGTKLIDAENFPVFNIVYHVVTDEFIRWVVPLFFFFSGFLFFYKTTISRDVWGKKWGKRVKTLLIPYLFWNLMAFALIFLTQTFLSSMTSGSTKLISEYNPTDYLNLFWDSRMGYPVAHQFWFIRDLMVVVLCSPLVYLAIKYAKVWAIIVLGVLWVCSWGVDVVGISTGAFFFFSFGAWFSLNKRNFVSSFRPFLFYSSVLYVLLCLFNTILWAYEVEWHSYIHNIGIIVGMVMVVSLVAFGLEKGKLSTSVFLAGSAFFVYAYHGMFVALLVKSYVKYMRPDTELELLIGYFVIPIVITAIGIFLYMFLKRYFPTFTNWITGDR